MQRLKNLVVFEDANSKVSEEDHKLAEEAGLNVKSLE